MKFVTLIEGARVISGRELRAGVREAMKISWVTLDRICEEQMRSSTLRSAGCSRTATGLCAPGLRS